MNLTLIPYLGLVPGLGLSPAAVGNVLVLGLDLRDNAVQVQLAVVVHGQDDRCVTDVGLDLRNLLQESKEACNRFCEQSKVPR